MSKHALRALTEVVQDGNHTNGIKAWVVCPGFVDTEMGHVVLGANPANFLGVEEVVDVVRFLRGASCGGGRLERPGVRGRHGQLTARRQAA